MIASEFNESLNSTKKLLTNLYLETWKTCSIISQFKFIFKKTLKILWIDKFVRDQI